MGSRKARMEVLNNPFDTLRDVVGKLTVADIVGPNQNYYELGVQPCHFSTIQSPKNILGLVAAYA
jgi:hypothetical protein